MKKISLKKLTRTALFLVLSLEANHPAFASDTKIDLSDPRTGINMNLLTPREKMVVAEMRRSGTPPSQMIAKILSDRKSATTENIISGPSQQHVAEIKALREEQVAAQQKLALQEKELERLRVIENERLKTLTGQDGGKSIPKEDVLSIAEIARLQDENKKLAKALEGFEEGSPSYKVIKEQLNKTQSDLEKIKKDVTSRGTSMPNPPSQLPPMQPKPTTLPPVTNHNGMNNVEPSPLGGEMKRGGMARGGPPPRGGPPVIKTPEQIQLETEQAQRATNKYLIEALNSYVTGITQSIDASKAFTSEDRKEHMKLLIRELLGTLKTYAEKHTTVPGLIAGDEKKKRAAVAAALDNLMNRLNISTTMLQFEKSVDTRALNTEESANFIAMITKFLEKMEQYIHAENGNPLELKGSNFSIAEILVPKKVSATTPTKSVTNKPSENKAKSTLKDTLRIFFDINKIPLDASLKIQASEEVMKALEDTVKSPNVFQDLSSTEPKALELLSDTSLSLGEIQELWKKIPEIIKTEKLKAFSDDLYNDHPIKGMAAEIDFLKLLQEKGISPQEIGLELKGSKTADFRDKVLRNFIALKLVSQIIIAYRASLGIEEDKNIKALQSKNYANNMHKESVENGSSPIKNEALQRLNETIKSVEEEIDSLKKKKESFKPFIQTSDKILLKLYTLFEKDYVVPALFKDFMRSSEAQNIMAHPDAQETQKNLDKKLQDIEDKNNKELEEKKLKDAEERKLKEVEEKKLKDAKIKRQQEAREKNL